MPSSPPSTAPRSTPLSVLDLSFTLHQTSPSLPTLLITLRNTSLHTPYTLLKWGTPLDSAALNTGMFTITDTASGEQIPQVVLKLNRQMPPGGEEFVTLAPGAQEEVVVELDKPWMPATKGGRYKMHAKGMFQGLWEKDGADVSAEEVLAYTEIWGAGRVFGTNEVVVEVQ